MKGSKKSGGIGIEWDTASCLCWMFYLLDTNKKMNTQTKSTGTVNTFRSIEAIIGIQDGLHYSASIRYGWVITQLLGQLKEAHLIYSSVSQLGHIEVKKHCCSISDQNRNWACYDLQGDQGTVIAFCS
jgi:hypothetical protein